MGRRQRWQRKFPEESASCPKSKEEFQSGWGISCFMRTPERWLPASVVQSGLWYMVGWGKGIDGSAAILAPFVFSSLVVGGWAGSKV